MMCNFVNLLKMLVKMVLFVVVMGLVIWGCLDMVFRFGYVMLVVVLSVGVSLVL